MNLTEVFDRIHNLGLPIQAFGYTRVEQPFIRAIVKYDPSSKRLFNQKGEISSYFLRTNFKISVRPPRAIRPYPGTKVRILLVLEGGGV